MKSRAYEWVPAGMESFRRGGPVIYVKYGRYPDRIEVLEKSSQHVWIRCPDRELVIVSNANHVHAFRPMQGNFDAAVSLSPFYEPSAVDHDYHYIMVNYTEYIGKEGNASRIRRAGYPDGGKLKIISDSGGFQVWREDIDYIDPMKLIEWCNDNVDLAMIFDIPTSARGTKHFRRLANIQARNTEIMVQNKRKDLELFNVFHGHTKPEVEVFRGITERDDINRLAIGGGYWGTVLGSISRWYGIMSEGRKYDHYHILGVQNVLQTLPIMRMVAKGAAPLITSDSTTHIQNAVSKNFYFHPHMSEPPKYINFGYRGTAGGYKPSPLMTLPCTCQVCSVIKYKDVMAAMSGHPIDTMMIYHNLYATQRYLRSMYEHIQTLTTKELKELVKFQFAAKKTRRKGVEDMLQAFDFIDCVASEGLEAARNKFKFYLPDDSGVQISNATLFKKNTHAVELVTPPDDPVYQRLDSVARKYESQDGVHGKKLVKKGKVSAIQSVKGSSRPGMKKKVRTKKKKKSNKQGP